MPHTPKKCLSQSYHATYQKFPVLAEDHKSVVVCCCIPHVYLLHICTVKTLLFHKLVLWSQVAIAAACISTLKYPFCWQAAHKQASLHMNLVVLLCHNGLLSISNPKVSMLDFLDCLTGIPASHQGQ